MANGFLLRSMALYGVALGALLSVGALAEFTQVEPRNAVLGVSAGASSAQPSGYSAAVERFRSLISEATGLKPDAFEVSYDARTEPTHLAAIMTSTSLDRIPKEDRAKVSALFRSGKPVFYMSALIAKLSETDDQLKYIIRHEFFHSMILSTMFSISSLPRSPCERVARLCALSGRLCFLKENLTPTGTGEIG